MSEHTHSVPLPEEPDILIQDLEDLPAAQPDNGQTDGTDSRDVCARCEEPVPYGETYCEACTARMGAYPIRPLAWICGAVGVVLFFVSLFLLATNFLIARPIVRGDRALREDDLRVCYKGYAESYDIASRLNDLLIPNASLTFFTNGARTLEKQLRAMYALNGPYQTGQAIVKYFGTDPPQSLQDVYGEYVGIAAFVEDMQQTFTDYRDSLEAGDMGDYDAMIALVDEGADRHPDVPAYLAQYYRFSVSYSMGDDTARTCALLDALIESAPDALWLYASEGIRAYDLDGQYASALAICSRLMQLDASNTSTVAYTMAQLRLLQKYDDALAVYDSALNLTDSSSEMIRQRAIVLMLQGETEPALDLLVDSYSPETATLEHIATICVCAYTCGDTDLYAEYKALLDSYMPFRQVDALTAGDTTLEDIFLTGGGEIQ